MYGNPHETGMDERLQYRELDHANCRDSGQGKSSNHVRTKGNPPSISTKPRSLERLLTRESSTIVQVAGADPRQIGLVYAAKVRGLIIILPFQHERLSFERKMTMFCYYYYHKFHFLLLCFSI